MQLFYLKEIGLDLNYKKTFYKKLSICLERGDLCILPTDTIYGISGHPNFLRVREKINFIKKRNFLKPFIYLTFDLNFFYKILNQKLPNWFLQALPISITAIVNIKTHLLSFQEENSIAIRFVDLFFLKDFKFALAPILISTSVNYTNQIVLNKENDILEFMKKHNEIKLTLIDEQYEFIKMPQEASTLIDFRNYPYKVIRLGNNDKVKKILNQFAHDIIIDHKT